MELSHGLRLTAGRIAQLIEDALDQEHAGKWDPDVLAELTTALEELHVAEEELIVQSEQLAQSHQAIDVERERYAELFDFAPDGYVETDELGKIVEANIASTQLLGVPTRFLVGKLIQAFVAPDDRKLVRSALANIKDGAHPQTLTTRVVPRNGSELWVEVRLGGHFDPAAGLFRVRWLFRDISDRLKLEQEIAQLHVSVDLLAALSEVNRLVEGEQDLLSSVLERLAELAHRVADADAGVMLIGDDGLIAVRATAGAAAHDICTEQIAGGGPAIDAQHDGVARIVPVEDLVTHPELARLALRHSVRALVIHPIWIDGAVRGTFNLYLRREVADAERLVQLLARSAAAAIANAQIYTGARNLAAHLATALESRGVIEQAKGILIAMQHCSPDEAFDILRRSSQRQNRKLRAIAEEIVEKFAAGQASVVPSTGPVDERE